MAIQPIYDRPDFGKFMRALLARIRGDGLAGPADKKTLALLEESMPSDLKALLHSWAHLPGSSWVQLGKWEIEKRALGSGADAVEGMDQSDFAAAQSVVVGQGYGDQTLVATWGKKSKLTTLYAVDREYGKIRYIGSFDDLIKDTLEELEDEGEDPGEDLQKIVALAKKKR